MLCCPYDCKTKYFYQTLYRNSLVLRVIKKTTKSVAPVVPDHRLIFFSFMLNTGMEEYLSSTSSSGSSPVSFTPSSPMESCSEESATERKHCINSSSLTSSCSCTLHTSLPEDVHNIPKEICPFLAPVFHELFNCSSECPQFDLHLDLTTGNFSQMFIEPNLLQEVSQSCIFDHYSVVRDHDGSRMIGLVPPVSPMNPEICKGLPHFLHPSLGCSFVESKNQECIPRNIVLKTLEQNISYMHSEDPENRSIMWKGNHYSQTKSSNSIREEFPNNYSSFTIQTGEENHFIHCNLEATFPKVLQDLPSDVCPFLAPVLHGLFNCSQDMCVDYVIIIDLKGHNITKIPLTKQTQPAELCPACTLDSESTSAVLFKIIEAVFQVLSESTFICKLLPDSMKLWIPGCSSSPLLESVSEDTCPPVAVMLESGSSVFTYSLSPEGQHEIDIHQLKWHGRIYDLENVTSGRNSLTVLKDQYSLAVDDQVVRKYDSKEMQISDSRSGPVFTAPLDLTGGALQEYVGQKDIFLPLHAPMVSQLLVFYQEEIIKSLTFFVFMTGLPNKLGGTKEKDCSKTSTKIIYKP